MFMKECKPLAVEPAAFSDVLQANLPFRQASILSSRSIKQIQLAK
jgi:hypothetical protein